MSSSAFGTVRVSLQEREEYMEKLEAEAWMAVRKVEEEKIAGSEAIVVLLENAVAKLEKELASHKNVGDPVMKDWVEMTEIEMDQMKANLRNEKRRLRDLKGIPKTIEEASQENEENFLNDTFIKRAQNVMPSYVLADICDAAEYASDLVSYWKREIARLPSDNNRMKIHYI